jgi:hypothetical protein
MQEETQTQEESQRPAMRTNNGGPAKRILPQNEISPDDSELARPLKKIKMSVALGVDLAE